MIFKKILIRTETVPLNNCSFSENAVIIALDKLNGNKTPGLDCIAPHVLKEAKFQICKPLSIMFNKSLNTGKIPYDWKLANVTPIEKKGDKLLLSNCRRFHQKRPAPLRIRTRDLPLAGRTCLQLHQGCLG